MRVQFSFILLISIVFLSFKNTPVDNDCSIMREGTFIYGSDEELVRVVIKGSQHVEYHSKGLYTIKSKIDWINDCEYKMIMEEVTIPDFPFSPGDVMYVKIIEVKGNEIFYQSTVKKQTWKGKFTKIKTDL